MNEHIAVVIGATGLVGTQLVDLLLKDDRFTTVRIFVRRSTGILHPKIEEQVIDFDRMEQWQQQIRGHVLFSALGTTLRKAGSKAAQYKIDHTYQYNFAKAAATNGIAVYVLVSSAMANPKSRIFYTRMKGELEQDIMQLPFQYIHIIQPGMLTGDRKEKRLGEEIGTAVVRFLNRFGIAGKQKPIDAALVAKAMINVSFKKENKVEAISLLEVFHAAGVK